MEGGVLDLDGVARDVGHLDAPALQRGDVDLCHGRLEALQLVAPEDQLESSPRRRDDRRGGGRSGSTHPFLLVVFQQQKNEKKEEKMKMKIKMKT